MQMRCTVGLRLGEARRVARGCGTTSPGGGPELLGCRTTRTSGGSLLRVIELTTERLRLRPLDQDDIPAYAGIAADPEVMRWITGRPLSATEAWWNVARYLGHWHLRGFGMWGLFERATGSLVGQVGLLEPDGDVGLELGWALARSAWGHGYAFEACGAALDHAATTLGRDRVACVIDAPNLRSIRLAERLGAVRTERTSPRGAELLVYELDLVLRRHAAPPG